MISIFNNKRFNLPCYICGKEGYWYYHYDNHKELIFTYLKYLIRKYMFYIPYCGGNQKINRNMALGIFSNNYICVCKSCGAGRIRYFPHHFSRWFLMQGSVVKDANYVYDKEYSYRAVSQINYLSEVLIQNNIYK